MRTAAITFPYWENEARVAQYRASACLTAQTVLAVPMLLTVILWIILLWHPTEILLARGRDAVKEKAETAWERITIPETRKKKAKKSPSPKKGDEIPSADGEEPVEPQSKSMKNPQEDPL